MQTEAFLFLGETLMSNGHQHSPMSAHHLMAIAASLGLWITFLEAGSLRFWNFGIESPGSFVCGCCCR